MAMAINEIEQKLKNFENKYDQIKGSAENSILSEVETAIKNIKSALDDAKSQSGEEAEVIVGSLSESVEEIEEYINSL